MQSGDTIEVFTSKVDGAGPSREWLEIAATPKARNGIKQWFAKSDREELFEQGREDIIEALRDQGLRAQLLIESDELRYVAEQFNRGELADLYEAVGKEDLKAASVAKRLVANLRGEDSSQRLPAKPAQHRGSRRRRTRGVHVEGFEDSLVRLAGCCNPVPGDEILGFVTKGRGISVHRDDCANASELADYSGARQVEVDWDASFSGQFRTSIEVRALDRDRLLVNVVEIISDHHLSISSATQPF